MATHRVRHRINPLWAELQTQLAKPGADRTRVVDALVGLDGGRTPATLAPLRTRVALCAALGLWWWPVSARASGMGGLGEGLHDAYVDVLVPIGLALPEYSLALREGEPWHGLACEVPFVVLDQPRWSFGPTVAWYPGAGSVAGRATLRYVFIPVSDESWGKPPEDSVALALGAGAFVESRTGWGPRVELRARYMFMGVLFLSVAYEPTVVPRITHGGELAAGLELPILL